MSAYRKHTALIVEIHGDDYEITEQTIRPEDGDRGLFIEEMRKNGQEDCHQSGELALRGGKWEWLEPNGGRSFDDYGIGQQRILDFLNENPPPAFDEVPAEPEADMNQIATEWAEARDVIALALTQVTGGRANQDHNAAAIIARLSHAGFSLEKESK